MKKITIIGIIFVTIIIILSSFPIISADDNENSNNNIKEKLQIIKENIYNKINKISDTLWYPGFFITLLLAPFILIYLIIAIILDIGNP